MSFARGQVWIVLAYRKQRPEPHETLAVENFLNPS
jgi:hypothetical protein